jgi:hypothetical protein
MAKYAELNKSAKSASFSWVKERMLLSRNKLKIANSVICWDMILMMDKLILFEVSSDLFFHFKTMFKNVSMRVFSWVVKLLNRPVPISKYASAFPIMVFTSKHPSVVSMFSIHGHNNTERINICQAVLLT